MRWLLKKRFERKFCDLPYPDTHFGIVITKGIIEKNRIISGPAYLEVEGIPLPLAIPFGFFPKPDSKNVLVIIPTFGEDQKLGFYLRNFGYYIVVNDYMDLTTTGTLYSKGSYELNEEITYRKRYKYDGNISFSYGSHNYGLEGVIHPPRTLTSPGRTAKTQMPAPEAHLAHP